jgi:hypothetical protein
MGSEMQPGVMTAQKREIQISQPDKICKFDPKSKKNYRITKSTNQNEHFPKKSIFSTLKVYGSQ